MRIALFATLTLFAASTALAQDTATEEARGAFAAGQAAYTAGRFAEALTYFERAYELTGEPDLLYNLATIHDRLRHDAQALEAYRGYLEARPGAEDRANIEARIAVLEEAIAQQSQAPAGDTRPGDAPPEAAPPDPPAQAEEEPDPQPAPARAGDPGPWIVTGIGAALILGGVASLIVTQLDLDAVSSGTRWADVQEAYDRVPILSATGWSLLGAGVAAMAGGLIWAAVGSGSSAEVAIGPGSFAVRGTF